MRAKPPPMTELQASRTLVKSPPELWAECSDATSLARHLDRFGEIRITRLDPETAVAWEGERTRGTVRIEPAGWGTKVILTAVADAPAESEGSADVADAPPEPEARAEVTPAQPEPPEALVEPEQPEPEGLIESPAEEPPPPERKRRWARLKAFWRGVPLPAEPGPAGDVEDATAPTGSEEPLGADEAPPPSEASLPPSEASLAPSEAPPPESDAPAPSETEAALAAALDSLGQAHHRPYSRA